MNTMGNTRFMVRGGEAFNLSKKKIKISVGCGQRLKYISSIFIPYKKT